MNPKRTLDNKEEPSTVLEKHYKLIKKIQTTVNGFYTIVQSHKNTFRQTPVFFKKSICIKHKNECKIKSYKIGDNMKVQNPIKR